MSKITNSESRAFLNELPKFFERGDVRALLRGVMSITLGKVETVKSSEGRFVTRQLIVQTLNADGSATDNSPRSFDVQHRGNLSFFLGLFHETLDFSGRDDAKEAIRRLVELACQWEGGLISPAQPA